RSLTVALFGSNRAIRAVAGFGRIGLVAVGDSAAEADALYRRTQSVLDEEARLALAPRALPAI
ncbi:MAG TPA: hypothetical protein VLA85_04925, partial [Verrucomicrobiae bacterium]|nr:hypothetical protein [Verrucomicrobiae bacterium]